MSWRRSRGIADLDDQTRKDGKAAEERFVASYPFHPDLIDVFYSKWTNLEGFQRTRGVLRTFRAGAARSGALGRVSPLVRTERVPWRRRANPASPRPRAS